VAAVSEPEPSHPAMTHSPYPPDFDSDEIALCHAVGPFTMTSPERIVALRDAVRYIEAHAIPGTIVECGVWKGGSMMAVACTLHALGRRRQLRLYDTFEGMPPPSAPDADHLGRTAAELLAGSDRQTSHVWARSPLEEVRRNLNSTGYDPSLVEYVAGRVEETISPESARAMDIALLRLDTDWYESTRHELLHLLPRLTVGGVLIIDDYGHWQGARRAVDEYFAEYRPPMLLTRIDYTGRIGVKVRPS
jgi:O-methyltransferase